MNIDNSTQVISSFAIKQSKLGAAMHNAAYEYLQANYIYIPFTVEDCENAIKGMKALHFRGSSISMPYKQEVMQFIDTIDPVALAIGAVNTVVNNNGSLTGYNTDWVGATQALQEVTPLENRKVALLGAGGAARAIVYALKQHHAHIIIFNRTATKGENLAKDFDADFGGDLEAVKGIDDYDILINATSVGFLSQTNELPIQTDAIPRNKVAFDVVFNPIETAFLKVAKTKQCRTISGYRMLIYQAIAQVELYVGRKVPFEVMEEALFKVLL
jgi:shikimate dehydrogenase